MHAIRISRDSVTRHQISGSTVQQARRCRSSEAVANLRGGSLGAAAVLLPLSFIGRDGSLPRPLSSAWLPHSCHVISCTPFGLGRKSRLDGCHQSPCKVVPETSCNLRTSHHKSSSHHVGPDGHAGSGGAPMYAHPSPSPPHMIQCGHSHRTSAGTAIHSFHQSGWVPKARCAHAYPWAPPHAHQHLSDYRHPLRDYAHAKRGAAPYHAGPWSHPNLEHSIPGQTLSQSQENERSSTCP